MKGNKLKHHFTQEGNKTPDDFIRRWRENMNRQIPNFIVETSAREWETIYVSEMINYDLLNLDREDTLELIKKEMTIKIAQMLYENNFIETIEEDRDNEQIKRITMRLNVEKR